MFSNLDDQIQQTNGHPTTAAQRLLRGLSVVCITSVLFGGLYLGILLLE